MSRRLISGAGEYRRALGAGAIIVGIDQISKAIADNFLETTLPIAPLLSFHKTTNTGIAFGLGSGWNPLYIIAAIAICSYIIWQLPKTPKRWHFPMGLILGGAVGNLIDRILWGAVTDFIHLQYFAVFNVADITITIGGAWLFALIVQEWHVERREKSHQKKER